MRLWVIFLAGAPLVLAQTFTFGVKGGMPLTDFLSATNYLTATNSGGLGYFTTTNRYVVGPEAELHLPFGFGVEIDALYRHLNYTNFSNGADVSLNSSTTSGSWEFPLLAKYHFPTKIVRPYVAAGIAWDTLSGLTQTITQTVIPTSVKSTSRTSNPEELARKTVTGFVAGLGMDFHLLFLNISPEIRYTRWGSQQFQSISAVIGSGINLVPIAVTNIGVLQSNRNQAEFVVGFTFPSKGR
jgi:opacity protein-like surface antigen